jgi:predicted Zn finger-like uncharacterized protein
MRFVCDSCHAQYMISDDKVGARGVKVRCKKCGHVIFVRRPEPVSAPSLEAASAAPVAAESSAALSDASDPSTASERAPSSEPVGKGFLAGLADDEIGAAFDQALGAPGTGAAGASAESPAPPADGSLIEKLLEASSAPASQPPASAEAPAEQNGASYDWFVAIEEKQVGPLAFEMVKDLWNRGEIGPDSLCWRGGFADWIPLSDVPELASLLAPKPSRPVIVAAAAVVSTAPPANVPVESVFSAGSASARAARPESSTPSGGLQISPEASGAWKPSAATALASLMKEEIDALAKPTAPPKPTEEPAAAPALLDVPATQSNGRHASASSFRAADEAAPLRSDSLAPQIPYTPSYGYPATARPRRGLIIALSAVGGFLVLALAVVTTILLMRPGSTEEIREKPKGASGAQSSASSSSHQQKPGPASAGQGTPSPGATSSAPSENAPKPPPPPPKVADNATAKPETSSRPDAPAGTQKPEPNGLARPEHTGTRRDRRSLAHAGASEEITAPRKVEKHEASVRSPQQTSEDDFDKEFGTEKRKASVPKAEPSKKPNVYVPPAPGGEVPESLGTAEIMQVVVDHKPTIMRCVEEQKKRDPSLTGPIVMSWTILASGKTTAISCASDEFKSTYMAQCLTGLIKMWQFPRHKVQGEPINFPFKF